MAAVAQQTGWEDERYMVVVNAANRASGSDQELRELIRAIFLGQEERWPDNSPSVPLGRPTGSAVATAFALDVLDMREEELETYWSKNVLASPEIIVDARELLQRVSRDPGALSVVARSEAEKLPARTRVLLEFSLSVRPESVEYVASSAAVKAYLDSHRAETAAALDAFIVDRGLPYGKRLREFISHRVLEDRLVGPLVELSYVGWSSPLIKQRAIARLEGGSLILYDPADAANLDALPTDPVGDKREQLTGTKPDATPDVAKAEGYFRRHESEMNAKLRNYIEQHFDQVPSAKTRPGQGPFIARIIKTEILESDGDLIRATIRYRHGHLTNPSSPTQLEGSVNFHLKWLDNELVFVGHETPKS